MGLKRLFDLTLAVLGLIAAAPVMLAIAIGIKLDDGGPILYCQKRVGQGGRSFASWKFRSMIPESDVLFGPVQAIESDRRITRIGRILRATAMDELPQLWNILRGDMSFVGPRPLMPVEIEVLGEGQEVPLEEIPGYTARHGLKPGLTGIAQIYADRDVPRHKKFRYDLLYARNCNLWLDLRLILVSLVISVGGEWNQQRRRHRWRKHRFSGMWVAGVRATMSARKRPV